MRGETFLKKGFPPAPPSKDFHVMAPAPQEPSRRLDLALLDGSRGPVGRCAGGMQSPQPSRWRNTKALSYK